MTLIDRITDSDPTDRLLADAIDCLLMPHLREAGDARLEVLAGVFGILVVVTEDFGLLSHVLDRLAEAGDLETILTTARGILSPSDRELLAGLVGANHPDLTALLR